LDLVRGALEAFARGDVEGMLSDLDPDVELHSAIVGGAEGNVYRGHEGFRNWYADSFESSRNLRTNGASFAISAIASSPSGVSRRAGARVAPRLSNPPGFRPRAAPFRKRAPGSPRSLFAQRWHESGPPPLSARDSRELVTAEL
jgi:hypothetical protein